MLLLLHWGGGRRWLAEAADDRLAILIVEERCGDCPRGHVTGRRCVSADGAHQAVAEQAIQRGGGRRRGLNHERWSGHFSGRLL